MIGTYVEGQDSAYNAGLARDLAQDLADDTALLVFDLRKRHGDGIDSAHAAGKLVQNPMLRSMSGGQVKWGLLVECRERKDDFVCKLMELELAGGSVEHVDSLRVLPEVTVKRKELSHALNRNFIAAFFPHQVKPSQVGTLSIIPGANPAMLVRGLEIVRRGEITEIPLGMTLVIGDSPRLVVVSMENIHYVLYPHSSYTYLLPKVVQLNQGMLGILKGVDTNSIEGKLRQATTLDKSNLIWRSLAKVAALDSTNVLWKGLGRVTSLDSHNLILKSLGQITALDSNNVLFKALGKVTSLDSSNLLLKTLSQVAALDSTNLVWKGLGEVSALDSNNLIWRKLNQIAALDSNSIWRKLGLLAFQDKSVVITPSFIAKGQPQAVLFRHEGFMSTLEVVKGEMSAQPLLSSQGGVDVGPLHAVRTRGFSLKEDKLNALRAEHILSELESVNPARNARNFVKFLPGQLFGVSASLRTADRPVQSFIASEFRELDMEVDVLSSEKEAWSEFNGTYRTGAEESACYLCSPGKLGP